MVKSWGLSPPQVMTSVMGMFTAGATLAMRTSCIESKHMLNSNCYTSPGIGAKQLDGWTQTYTGCRDIVLPPLVQEGPGEVDIPMWPTS